MGKYDYFQRYLDNLKRDVYPQPEDPGHKQWVEELLEELKVRVNTSGMTYVLDVGCGQAFVEPMLQNLGWNYVGVTLGNDAKVARKLGHNVSQMDYHFLLWDDETFEIIFSRHSLEHSPMPLLALMEWYRVSKKYLVLVLPDPAYWGWAGRNHYSVLHLDQAKFLLDRSGWNIIWETQTTEEFRFLCEKKL